MRTKLTNSTIPLLSLILLLASCATIPPALQGEYSSLTPAQAKANHSMNQKVRWSGLIIHTINKKDKTCFEIVQTETDKSLRPKRIIPKNGSRFLACKEGFLEPQAFDKRMVAITGNLVAYTKQNIGQYEYEYPVVKTDVIYIWRKQAPINPVYFSSFATFNTFHCGYSVIHGYCF